MPIVHTAIRRLACTAESKGIQAETLPMDWRYGDLMRQYQGASSDVGNVACDIGRWSKTVIVWGHERACSSVVLCLKRNYRGLLGTLNRLLLPSERVGFVLYHVMLRYAWNSMEYKYPQAVPRTNTSQQFSSTQARCNKRQEAKM